MIDTTRWTLTEAWLSLGLHVEWTDRFDDRMYRIQDSAAGGRSFVYAGHKRWLVQRDRGERTAFGYEDSVSPELATGDMLHELAHYIAATKDQRETENFGMGIDASVDRDMEDKALLVEQGIRAILRASGRIASLALSGRPEP